MMRSLLVKLLALSMVLFIVACGRDDDDAIADDGVDPESEELTEIDLSGARVSLFSTDGGLETGPLEETEIRATVRSEDGLLLSDIPVRLRVLGDDPAEYRPAEGTETDGGAMVTDESGSVTALLSSPLDRTNRTIELVGAVGDAESDPLRVQAMGTSISGEVPSSGTIGDEINLSFRLQDSQGLPIADETLEISSESADGVFSPSSEMTTGDGGFASVDFTVSQPAEGGTDTLVVTGAGAQTSFDLAVTDQLLRFESPDPDDDDTLEIELGESDDLTVRLTQGGGSIEGVQVAFGTTRGSITPTDTTDANGEANATLTAGSSAGPSIVTAQVDGGPSTTQEVLFVATEPNSLNLQLTPGTVAPEGESEVMAVVRDSNNQLVKNQTVKFSITEDSTGSSLRSPSAITDRFGRARTTFEAGEVSGAQGGVEITASVQGAAVWDSATMTISGEALFITLGTGNEISRGGGSESGETLYIKPYSALVTDASGAPVSGLELTLDAFSKEYQKGFYEWEGAPVNMWVRNETSDVCESDDIIDRNGIYEPGKDQNDSGDITPGNVATVSGGSIVTDDDGFANFEVVYPQDHAAWVWLELTARGEVAGTESQRRIEFRLPFLAEDITDQEEPPAFRDSPFGTGASCFDTD